ncbi:response regulator transcription factor [Cellulomonas hominis]|nr:response regulator transcription factor [Cellulomonas hominis]MBU5422303.1 response regulator transcription factor [Cellulomonas hominis]
MTQLLLVEDDRELADVLAPGLRSEGYAVGVVHDGAAALAWLGEHDADVVVLDRDLPVLHGDAVCRALRAAGHPAAVLMLTAAAGLDERISGLDSGADDYLAKPFAYLELLARLRALVRRSGTRRPTVLVAADVRLDPGRRVAERAGRPLHLTAKELAVLETLLGAAGGFVSADDLVDEIWGAGDRTRGVVKTTVHTLRAKLGAPDLIASAPGLGYRIAAS